MSDFQFTCSSCGQSLETPADMVGQLIDCPSCGETIEVSKSNPALSRPSLPKRTTPKNINLPTPRNANPNIPQFRMDGVGAELLVYTDKVEIVTKGVTGFVLKGLKGTKMIPYQSITAIQFKESGVLTGAGYLQFTVPGGIENRNGLFAATMDENTFMFHGHNECALKLKNYIESQIRILRNPPPAPTPQQPQATVPNFAADLERLAALFRQGVLSEDEFKQAKARLLG